MTFDILEHNFPFEGSTKEQVSQKKRKRSTRSSHSVRTLHTGSSLTVYIQINKPLHTVPVLIILDGGDTLSCSDGQMATGNGWHQLFNAAN